MREGDEAIIPSIMTVSSPVIVRGLNSQIPFELMSTNAFGSELPIMS